LLASLGEVRIVSYREHWTVRDSDMAKLQGVGFDAIENGEADEEVVVLRSKFIIIQRCLVYKIARRSRPRLFHTPWCLEN
jgi:hypothetical protein